MGPNQTLLALFLGLYLLECFTYVKAHEQLFVQGWWGPFRRGLSGLQLKPLLPSGASLLVAYAPAMLDHPPGFGAVEAVQTKVKAYQAKAFWLNLSGLTLIMSIGSLLMLFSWNTYNQAWLIRFIVVASVVILSHLCNITLLWRAWRPLHGSAPGRKSAVAITCLSPWASSRAADLLARPLLRGAHPVAVAEALLGSEDKKILAGELLRRALHPKAGEAVDSKAWQTWLKAQGYDFVALSAAPAPSQSTSSSYCPRCLAQYTHAEGICVDCNVVLVGF